MSILLIYLLTVFLIAIALWGIHQWGHARHAERIVLEMMANAQMDPPLRWETTEDGKCHILYVGRVPVAQTTWHCEWDGSLVWYAFVADAEEQCWSRVFADDEDLPDDSEGSVMRMVERMINDRGSSPDGIIPDRGRRPVQSDENPAWRP